MENTVEQDYPVSEELSGEEYEKRQDLIRRINHTLNKIRPYINADGGDVEFVDFEDGVVTVSMVGACVGCMALDTTINDGIKLLLIDEVPEVKDIKVISASPMNYFY